MSVFVLSVNREKALERWSVDSVVEKLMSLGI